MSEYKFKVNGDPYEVKIDGIENGIASVSVNGKALKIDIESCGFSQINAAFPIQVSGQAQSKVAAPAAKPAAAPAPAPAAAPAPVAQSATDVQGTKVESPLPGVIKSVSVKPGDKVQENQVIMTLEAMKMENEICAECSGTILAVNVAVGQSVMEGQVLVVIG
ncbi:MAG: biotin/lipoyl-binding protein [Bacteroidales bacterium]|nr:biotin/lipoyl-binding protein [Candidatus Cryptobacteroides fimicaballi]